MNPFRVVIPARFASTRLPGKPLRTIAGRPMIAHVCDRARESGAVQIVVATDDTRIASALEALDIEVCMTATEHNSGTERIAEVVDKMGWSDEDIVVNLQGDEPLMPPQVLSQVAQNLAAHTACGMATLCTPIADMQELFNPNVVKVVSDEAGCALYFSRAAIPWDRDGFAREGKELAPDSYFRHLGIYAYRAGFIKQYVAWSPSPLERLESLEQLRALAHGARIHIAPALAVPGPGVDTEADLLAVEEILSRG